MDTTTMLWISDIKKILCEKSMHKKELIQKLREVYSCDENYANKIIYYCSRKKIIKSTHLHLYDFTYSLVKALILIFVASQLLHAQTYPIIGFGDYGKDGPDELSVKNLVYNLSAKNSLGLPLSHIITYGDNNYEYGSEGTIEANIGKYYSQWIKPFKGSTRWLATNGRLYSGSKDSNRFHPCLGNHDGYNYSLIIWYDWFGIPRYYIWSYGNVSFFIINSAYGNSTILGRFNFEPDGIDSNSVQAQWLKTQLRNSSAKFKIVVMHHPPYSSVQAGYEDTYWNLRWNYKIWGASAIVCGHNHLYEFLIIQSGNNAGLPIFVVGTGGGDEAFASVVRYPGSQVLIQNIYGAQFYTPYADSLNLKFIDVNYAVRHSYTLRASGSIINPPQQDSLRNLGDSVKVLWKREFQN